MWWLTAVTCTRIPNSLFMKPKHRHLLPANLMRLGLQYQRMADNGLVALIKGDKPSGNVVALRADMDALPITEANDVSYKSQNTGKL